MLPGVISLTAGQLPWQKEPKGVVMAALGAWIGGEVQVLAPAYGIELQAFSLALIEAAAIAAGAGILGWIGARIAVGMELKALSTRR